MSVLALSTVCLDCFREINCESVNFECTPQNIFDYCNNASKCTEDDRRLFRSDLCCCDNPAAGNVSVVSRKFCSEALTAQCLDADWLQWSPDTLYHCTLSLPSRLGLGLVTIQDIQPSIHTITIQDIQEQVKPSSSTLSDECLMCLVEQGFTCSKSHTLDWTNCDDDCWKSVFSPNECLVNAENCINAGMCTPPFTVVTAKTITNILRHIEGDLHNMFSVPMIVLIVFCTILVMISIMTVASCFTFYKNFEKQTACSKTTTGVTHAG